VRAWDDVLAAALLGTERRPPPGPGGEEALARVAPVAAERGPANALLASAATLTVLRRAGQKARPTGPDDPAPPAPPEHEDVRREVGAAAAAHLDALLAGRHTVLLGEWLAVAHARARRPPHTALPDLLSLAARRPALRDPVAAIAGPRGAWLAAQRGQWRHVVGAGPPPAGAPAAWRTGARDERLALLRALRAVDPAAARGLLDQTWAKEAPDDRATFVGVLGVGLSTDDEPLLARALGDRRKAVRTAAAALLVRLPASAFARTVGDAARAVLRVDGGAWAIDPPRGLPSGLEATRPPRGVGERAHRLAELLAAAPLATWGDPQDALARPLPREWADAVLSGWARAAAKQRDGAWARALLAVVDDAALLALLPAEERESVCAARLREETGARRGGSSLANALTAADLLDACDAPWGPVLTDAVVAAAAKALGARRPEGIEVVVLERLPLWAAKLGAGRIDVAEQAIASAAAGAAYGARPAYRALEVLAVRRDMLAALTEEP